MLIPLEWQIAKFLIAVLMVWGLVWVAERVTPRVAGILSGYPLGSALALFFMALELGAEPAAEAAGFSAAGFSATLALAVGYRLGGQGRGIFGALAGLGVGLTAWGLVVLMLLQWRPGAAAGALLTAAAMGLSVVALRRTPEVRVRLPARISWRLGMLRALLAAALVLLITALAHAVSPSLRGYMAAFPITMLPMLVLLHLAQGPAPVATAIKHYPAGLGALLGYSLTIAWAYPLIGVVWGTLLGFLVATLWLLLLLRLPRIGS